MLRYKNSLLERILLEKGSATSLLLLFFTFVHMLTYLRN